MSGISDLKRQLDEFESKKDIEHDSSMSRLTKAFMDRARHNLETANVVYALSNTVEMKKSIKIREGFECFDWAIIAGYYAMYHAALALLSTKGLKSRNHTATIVALEYYFVYQQELTKKDISLLKSAQLRKEDAMKLRAARNRREAVQYDVEAAYQKKEAEEMLKDATEFLNKIDQILHS
jgi:uncharacterized protein (UPF0332 family)